MRTYVDLGATRKFLKKGWRFHHAFATPLKNLKPYVETILSAVPEIRGVRLTVDAWVFEPKKLIALLHQHSLETDLRRDRVIEAVGIAESTELLEAALGCWIDFSFVPDPAPFSFFASHDEYTTFFSHSRANLNRVVATLKEHGFRQLTPE